MSEDSGEFMYLDDLFLYAHCLLIIENPYQLYPDLLGYYAGIIRMREIVLDMTGCIDADAGEY